MRDVHWCVTVFYQQIENSNIANQIHGFTIDYGKFILNTLNVRSRGKQLVLFSRESWCFPKLTSLPRNHALSVRFVIYLDFHIAKTNKQRRRAGNNCAIVSRSGYIWIWSGARDQESANHSAHFVEWKSSYITTLLDRWHEDSRTEEITATMDLNSSKERRLKLRTVHSR